MFLIRIRLIRLQLCFEVTSGSGKPVAIQVNDSFMLIQLQVFGIFVVNMTSYRDELMQQGGLYHLWGVKAVKN